jgi:uncharacterized membrane protein
MDKWLYRASIVLATVGLLVSTYMTIYKETGNTAMCLGSGGCDTVIHSRYSEINKALSVPEFGVIGFAVILAALAFEGRNSFLQKNGTLVVFGLALTGFLFVLWLVYVETVLIKAFCPFCVTTQITMTLVFILAIIRLIKQPQS